MIITFLLNLLVMFVMWTTLWRGKCFCRTYWEMIVQAASRVISISLFFIYMPISFYYTIINVVCMLFQFTCSKWCSKYIMLPSCNASNNKIVLLHKYFDHSNNQILMHLLKNVCSINLSSNSVQQSLEHTCEAWQMGKIHMLHFPITKTKTTKALELVHTDLFGLSTISSRDGYTYCINFVDDFIRCPQIV